MSEEILSEYDQFLLEQYEASLDVDIYDYPEPDTGN